MTRVQKAIYGLAMPFNDCYVDAPKKDNDPFIVERTSEHSIYFDEKVGITLQHDYSQHMGATDDNLTVRVNENGVYFKLVPNSPLGSSAYKKVKRSALRHCSLSYIVTKEKRNTGIEDNSSLPLKAIGVDDQIIVKDYKEIIIYEICLTNGPANKDTFCTVDPNDERLKGIEWDGDSLPMERVCDTDGLRYKENLKDYVECANQLIETAGKLLKSNQATEVIL